MKEIWKDIEGYEGLYQVSNMGRVKSFHNNIEKILIPINKTNEYLFVNLYKNGKNKVVNIHRLVAETFINNPNPNKFIEVLHLDDNPKNNVYTNLKWGTHKENCNASRHRELLSKAHKGKFCGELNSFYGKHHTEETKEKMRESLKRRRININE